MVIYVSLPYLEISKIVLQLLVKIEMSKLNFTHRWIPGSVKHFFLKIRKIVDFITIPKSGYLGILEPRHKVKKKKIRDSHLPEFVICRLLVILFAF